MRRVLFAAMNQMPRMANLPPRKASTSTKTSKQCPSPLQILLQMGFTKQRALKALAATGNRSVQLASDWLLTHVNDASIDSEERREYIFYANPTGPLLNQLLEFWEKSKLQHGWNGAHNFPPHVTLVSFFKAPDETSLQLAKAVKQVVETVGDPPENPLKLEPYVSHNFMGLFVSAEHADYLKKIALQFVKQVSSILGVTVDTYEHLDALGTCFPWCTMPQEKSTKSFVNLEAHVKSLHITLAYHFDVEAYDGLKKLVEELQPAQPATNWELRLYSRDPRFSNHHLGQIKTLVSAFCACERVPHPNIFVYKVTQGYSPKASDELELVLGDYVYVEQKEFDSSSDGWVHGTSWLTGISGYLPAVYTQRTAESDAWTLHRAVSLENNNLLESKSESDSNTDCEMSTPLEHAPDLGREKSEESYKEWAKYWSAVNMQHSVGYLKVAEGDDGADWKPHIGETKNGHVSSEGADKNGEAASEAGRRWVFALRHGERVDLTYGQWTPYCFNEEGKYVRKDLNMPISLPERAGGVDSFGKDTPLTRVGCLQAYLVGEGLRLANVSVKHVYSSSALRCVETANEFLKGLQADPSVKIRVEPGLFEYKLWHMAKGLAPFMTPTELLKAGYNVDVDYKPYVDLHLESSETLEEFYQRSEKVMQSAVKDTEAEGGNIIFVGHAATLDLAAITVTRLEDTKTDHPPYQISKNLLRVPYCALGALRGKPWQVVCPPCPPSINSSSGRFDWKLLLDF